LGETTPASGDQETAAAGTGNVVEGHSEAGDSPAASTADAAPAAEPQPPAEPPPPSPAEILEQIKDPVPTIRFLQSWHSEGRCLNFGCGDGEKGVRVTLEHDRRVLRLVRGNGEPARRVAATIKGGISLWHWKGDRSAIMRTRLSQSSVKRLENMNGRLDGRTVFTCVRSVLHDYLHFDDERLYDLIGLWILGTYLYVLFSHFGYLFLHSLLKRSAKTRLLEVISHLAFDATRALTGPTAPTIREVAAEGRTVLLDTLERWKEKSKEAYAALMEFLDAGFRNGGTVSKMESDEEG
jgi:hypothetical protein